MLDFSFAEIALVVVVAVLFIGPDELPVVIRTVGKAMRGFRGLMKEMHALFDEISRESGLDEVSKEIGKEIHMIKGDDGKMYEAYHMTSLPPLKSAAEIAAPKVIAEAKEDEPVKS